MIGDLPYTYLLVVLVLVEALLDDLSHLRCEYKGDLTVDAHFALEIAQKVAKVDMKEMPRV